MHAKIVSPALPARYVFRIRSQLERFNRCIRRLERKGFFAPAVVAELVPDHSPFLLLLEPGVAVDA